MISEDTIQSAVNLLKEAGHPLRIILMGSYSRGTPTEESDLDLLVIMSTVRNRREEMVRLRRVLSPLRIPVDVIVIGEQAFRDWSDTPGNIFFEAAQEGRVLYEAA
jgi:predicted nucleotidyltransferase